MPRRRLVYVLCFLAFAAHAAFSVASRPLQAVWANVPPVPSVEGAAAFALGDRALAYRMYGIMIQNLGDTGGRVTSLKDYDYDRLGQWFLLEDRMDWRSDFIPLLAAYYFGGTQNAEELGPVIDYLALAGQRTYGQKWRWLAQAAYLARFREEDMDKAMRLATLLSALDVPDMPVWASQMPAIIAGARGDRETALKLTLSVLQDESRNLDPTEVYFMVDYICTRLLDKTETAQYPFCVKDQKE